MPVLDAKALETDPEGMAFLRSVLRPTADKEAAGSEAGEAAPRSFPRAFPAESDKPRIVPPRPGDPGVPAAA